MLSVSQLGFVLDGVKRSKVSMSCQLGKNLQFGWKRKRNYVKGNSGGCQRKGKERKVPGKVVVTKMDRNKSGVFAGAMHEFPNRNRPHTVAKCPSMKQVNIHYKKVESLQTCR
jgi:hypothetical protein